MGSPGKVLSAQQNGMLESLGILLSDPRRPAEVNANAKGDWQVSAQALRAAQDAYSYRVIQMAYQSFWPQIGRMSGPARSRPAGD